jgi:predicted DNA-binding transcriptional regulator AlpA
VETRFLFFNELETKIQLLGIRRLVWMSQRGHFPPFSRLSGHSARFWSAQAVHEWLRDKLAQAEGGVMREVTPLLASTSCRPALIEMVDGEPPP